MNKNKYVKLIDSSNEKFDLSILKKSDQKYDKPEHFSYESYKTIKGDGTEQFVSGNYWGIKQKIILPKGWFNIQKEYYSNGNIKSKRIYNKTSPGDYGLMYEFDENGKLTKTINFDEGWQTSFEKITEISKKYIEKYNYKIDVSADAVINADQQWKKEYIKIWRKENNGKKYWQIGLNKAHYDNPDDKKCERVVILVDDSSGKIVKSEHYFDKYNSIFQEL
ncbi:hypothetical protein QWZ06_20740 [Chryseobacterium tructae]|uniref:MORN repeat variant n=1 Tax=Chryseobacterium tructae TaxID=1037380 RepID=A0ABV7Y582_9FLAO|nr:hypothetical protein [Chryseobacterium tructae]MDN3694518.1 hypothetical protein [Chryseobacterium tructae]